MAIHTIHSHLLTREVNIDVIGAGGTGSQLLVHLARLHIAMLAQGHPHGLHVTVWDDDVVSEANIGRQAFYPCDIGTAKAATLVNRINMGFGTKWESRLERVTQQTRLKYTDIVIGCVDNRLGRTLIVNSIMNVSCYYLDCGNAAKTGQVVLGESEVNNQFFKPQTLPHALQLFPDLKDVTKDATDDAPSCSLAEALLKQSLMINSMVALMAANILTELFTKGQISHHGAFINLDTGRINPLPIDEVTWKRLGFEFKKPKGRKKAA